MQTKSLIEALHPFGDVLEVGFGPASKEIQKYHPQSHTIISSDPAAKEWASHFPTVKIIDDIWQSALPSLGVFDTIFFGVDPVENQLQIRMRYSDSELDMFCHGVTEKKHLSRFLAELERDGQIDAEQREKMIKKYHLTHAKAPHAKRSGQMFLFLKQCLETHMRKGSRFSCLLKSPESPSEDLAFFNEIVVNPILNYREDGQMIVIEKVS